MVALPILCVPVYGFIHYMNLDGIWLFVLIAWLGVSAAAFALWRPIGRQRLPISCGLAVLSTYLPVIIAFSVALHPMLWRRDDPAIWDAVRFSTLIGGLFTIGYWLPASIVNCFALRRLCRSTRQADTSSGSRSEH